MIEGIVLGIIQGVTEWLPISSEGVLILVKVNFFSKGESLKELIGLALFLHLGTFLAAAWYLRDDVVMLLKLVAKPHRLFERGEGLLRLQQKRGEAENMLRFLVLATFISGIIGYFLITVFITSIEQQVEITTKVITLAVGILLLGTAAIGMKAKRRKGQRKGVAQLKDRDGVLLGVVQGFSALPGFSRSGLTISTLLLRKFDDVTALRLSFLMSLPIVLGGNIVLNATDFAFNLTAIFGVLFAFIFGFLTIHLLFRFARKINFAYFVLFFGILTIFSVFL